LDRPDNDLIKAYLNGDAEAFTVLYERYKRQIYAFLLKMLADDGNSIDDLFQQVWIKTLKNLHRYHNRDRFLAWLFSIARNTALDYFRKQKRNYIFSELDSEDTPEIENVSQEEPWRNMDRSELSAAVDEALKRLPAEQREVFVMRQENMSFKEIAAIHDCSINTALARMQYAVKNLRKELGQWDIGGK
jgi:RNA polymerase sigma-70 factor (ECF subfamily)